VGMSCIDICASFGWFLSTWAVPEETGFALARGTTASCNFQGFLLQLAVGAPLYNSSLALFYLMVIKYNWTNGRLQAVEKMVHAAILIFSIGTSILLLPLTQYNHIGAVCWVIGEPQGCGHSTNTPNPDVPCERGDYAYLYGLALFYGPLWVCVILCIICMAFIFFEVRSTHRRLHRYGRRNQSLRRSAADTSAVATQAALYCLSFFFTWMPSTIWSIAYWFGVEQFWLDLLAAICEPLQGFINMLIFIRRRQSSQLKIYDLFVTIFPFGCWDKLLPCCGSTKRDRRRGRTDSSDQSWSGHHGARSSRQAFSENSSGRARLGFSSSREVSTASAAAVRTTAPSGEIEVTDPTSPKDSSSQDAEDVGDDGSHSSHEEEEIQFHFCPPTDNDDDDSSASITLREDVSHFGVPANSLFPTHDGDEVVDVDNGNPQPTAETGRIRRSSLRQSQKYGRVATDEKKSGESNTLEEQLRVHFSSSVVGVSGDDEDNMNEYERNMSAKDKSQILQLSPNGSPEQPIATTDANARETVKSSVPVDATPTTDSDDEVSMVHDT